MSTLKKDHRGLRRRPLYTPLGIGIVSIIAAVLVGVGLGEIVGWTLVGPLILIALGVSALLRGVFRRD